MTLEEKIAHLQTSSMEQARVEGNAIIDAHRIAEKENILLSVINTMRNIVFGIYKKIRYIEVENEK